MGFSLGGSYGQSNQSSTGTSNTANTYAPGQTGLQTQLGSALGANLSAAQSGTLSPGVQAQKTASADAINKTSGGTLDRVNSFLAARGFGKSGDTGKAALQTELGRQSDLAKNEADYAQVQQNLNSTNLMAALNYAFTALGQTSAGTSTGKSSGWGVSAGVAGVPGG
jgi:hypothetical protein